MTLADSPQRIVKLTPLKDVEAAVGRIARPVAARGIDLDLALGRVLAADVVAAGGQLARAVALRDGWAVNAQLVADAGAYAPVPVAAEWIEAGATLPPEADAVLPPDAVSETHGTLEAIAAAAPGEGVLRALEGGESAPLREAGRRLRASDIAALRAAGVQRVGVREPMVNVVATNRQIDARSDSACPLIAAAVEAAGGRAHIMRASAAPAALENALRDGTADIVITVGGTGEGRGDRAVAVVAGYGEIVVRGMGIKPGESATLAEVGARPILMLPGRLDAALAAWLLVGRLLLRSMTQATGEEAPFSVTLGRKVASTVGIAEAILVRLADGVAEPLASGALPAHVLAQADGWVLVPAESEGHPAGATVEMRPLP